MAASRTELRVTRETRATALPGAAWCRGTTAGRFFGRGFTAMRYHAFGVFDREGVTARLSRRRDFITRGAAFGSTQPRCRFAFRRRNRLLDFGELGRFGHQQIATVVVGRRSLHRGLSRASELLRRSVGGLALLVQERRDRNRGENADDQDDNQKLDKGKTTLILRALAQSIQHLNPPRIRLQGRQPSVPPPPIRAIRPQVNLSPEAAGFSTRLSRRSALALYAGFRTCIGTCASDL